MARTRAFVLFVAVLLVLSGCSAFFDFNAFSSLDKPAAPDRSRYQGLNGLSNLQTDLASPSIVKTLKNDSTLTQNILLDLLNDPTHDLTGSPPWNSAQQTAAALYGDLALKSTSGDELVNNIVAAVLTQAPGNIKGILQSIVPSDVIADQTGAKFANMIAGLFNANIVYQKLGASIPPTPPGMNMGDVAQKAAVAYLMFKVEDAVANDPAITAGPYDPVAEMFLLVNNQPNHIPSGLGTTPANPLKPLPGWLKNIFDAAGAPYPA
jgi:hypothetical protein